MGAWFQVQVELITHPKTTRLRKQLKCSQGEAAGIILGLFTWGVEHATKEGFFICEDEGDFGSYLQYVNAGTMLTPEGMVEGLKETGWLDITESGPRIHDWDTWQAALYKAKERRESDAARKRETRRNKPPSQPPNASKDEDADIPQDRPQDSPQDSPAEEPAPPAVPEPPKYTPAFETFWKAYLLYRDGVDRTDEVSKLLYLKRICEECEGHGCTYNHNGECRFALVHERKPEINDIDGCVDYDYAEGRD